MIWFSNFGIACLSKSLSFDRDQRSIDFDWRFQSLEKTKEEVGIAVALLKSSHKLWLDEVEGELKRRGIIARLLTTAYH